MNTATEPVLEILQAGDDWKSPSDINVNIIETFDDAPSRTSVYRALNDLTAHEYTGDADLDESTLIDEKEFEDYGTYYRITELGEAYLDGEIDGGQFEEEDTEE